MLKRVHFAGIKSLLDVTVDLEPFTVLVGPNGCGKSTVLDQIEVVTAMTQPGRGINHVLGAGGEALSRAAAENLNTSGLDRPMVWEAVGEPPERVAQISIDRGTSKPWYHRTLFTLGTGDQRTHFNGNLHEHPLEPFQTAQALQFSWRSQRLALLPPDIAAASPVDAGALAPSGYGLPTILKDLAGNDTGAFLRLQEDMRRIVPHFRSLRFGKAISNGSPTVTLELEMQQGRIPAWRASDGTLIALALLTATHNPDLPSLILMDDLDHGLHLSAQIELVDAIRRVMSQRAELQVVCTTHSPVLLDRFSMEEVRVMALDSEGYTRVRPLAEHPDLDAWRRGYSTGELWANLGESWVIDG